MYHSIKAFRLGSQSHLQQVGVPKQASHPKLTSGEGRKAKSVADREQTGAEREQKRAEASRRGASQSRERA